MLRRVKWSVLAVGEGDAEVAFLQHLKQCYISRGCGSSLTVKQAFGKGARNVVLHAIRYSDGQDYDRCIALFDTDVDYTEEVRQMARRAKIVTIPSEPCLEGFLLKCSGDDRRRCSDEHKTEFIRRFGGRVQDVGIIPNVFDRVALEAIRDREYLIHKLINTFGVPRAYI